MTEGSTKALFQSKLPDGFLITYFEVDERMFGNVTSYIHCPYCSFRLEIDRDIVEGEIVLRDGSARSIEQWLRNLGCKSKLKIGYSFDEFAQGLRDNLESLRRMGQD